MINLTPEIRCPLLNIQLEISICVMSTMTMSKIHMTITTTIIMKIIVKVTKKIVITVTKIVIMHQKTTKNQ
jgi:hypothetical protein